MEENGLNLGQCLLASGIGWLTAMAISGVFDFLRRILPRPTAFPGMGIAFLWLVSEGVFLLLAISQRDWGWVQTALIASLPLLGCAGVAWWHQTTLEVPRITAFGILIVEFVAALITWGIIFSPCKQLCFTLLGSDRGVSHVYQYVLPVLLLTLVVEEIARPVRRRTRTEAIP